MTIITYQEVTTRYGLTPAEVRGWLDVGLLEAAPAPDAVQVPDPDALPYLARLHHELHLPPESLHIIAGMRQRLLALQAALAEQQARAAQWERFGGSGGGAEDL